MSKNDKFQESIKDLKESITTIQKGFEDLCKSGLNQEILVYSLQKCSQKHNPSYTPIKIVQIRALLKGIEEFKEYMFPEDNQ